MTSIEILSNLQTFVQLAATLAGAGAGQTPTIRSAYDFVMIDFETCHCKFKVSESEVKVEQIHCDDKARTSDIEKLVKAHRLKWSKKPPLTTRYSAEVIGYLKAADEIAAISMNRSSGDDYRPGFYSEIEIGSDSITLRQINRMNSKSLDHKDDYLMRDLEFVIPLGTENAEKKLGFGERAIGRMRVSFEDRSSKQHRAAGDEIEKKITEKAASTGNSL